MPHLQLKKYLVTETGTLPLRCVAGGITNRGTTTVFVLGEELAPNESMPINNGGTGLEFIQNISVSFSGTGTNRLVVIVSEIVL